MEASEGTSALASDAVGDNVSFSGLVYLLSDPVAESTIMPIGVAGNVIIGSSQ
jgi:hypothetical protein